MAMAAGLRVVASRHSEIPEVVLHNRIGLLAGERNNEEIAKHLVALLGNREMRELFGREGRKFPEEHLDNRVLNEILAERITLAARAQA
jgi:colanic acid/amylovoran biosynthesis glycosyltransferase